MLFTPKLEYCLLH